LFFAEFDGGHSFEHEPDVEHEEGGEQDTEESAKGLPEHEKKHLAEGRYICPHFSFHGTHHIPHDRMGSNDTIEKEEEEVFVVPKTDTIVDPRTMMVHPQHACAANTAMVTPVRFELRAPLAIAAVTRLLRF